MVSVNSVYLMRVANSPWEDPVRTLGDALIECGCPVLADDVCRAASVSLPKLPG